MPAISVVMSVYNTEKYVSKAIESILNQTFTDYEFLIINNGCTDHSGEIITSYAEKDSRIRVIKNKSNVFIAEARNSAISQAKGQYLYLIDSDDWALPNMLEVMYDRAKQFDAQYVVAGYFMDYDEGGQKFTYEVCPDDQNYTQQDFRNNAIRYITRTILTVPWNKLYSIPYLREHHIVFRNTKLEDHHFNMDIIMDVERVCMISQPFYHYYRSRQGTDSQVVFHKFLNQKKREHFQHTLEVYKHWGIEDQGTMRELANYHMGRLVECVAETVCNPTITKANKKSELRIIFNDELTKFAKKYAKLDSFKLKVLSLPIYWKNECAAKMFGHTIGFVKKNFSCLYYKMRSKVAQKAKPAQEG